jgi:putative transposase
MPFVKVMIHAVWGTKNREPFLASEIRRVVIEHIKENAKEKKIYIDTINGYEEHLHCLFGLNADMSLSKALQLIKGESAYWINKNGLIKSKFEWADEYFAASVSESALDKVRAYIDNQEQHHRKVTFTHEYQQFIDTYKFESQG